VNRSDTGTPNQSAIRAVSTAVQPPLPSRRSKVERGMSTPAATSARAALRLAAKARIVMQMI
jgi:hypothetical protein